MATISLTLSAKADKTTGKSEILIRFVVGSRINQRGGSNIFINAKHWNAKEGRIVIPKFRLMNDEQKQLVSDLQAADTQLANLKENIMEAFNKSGIGKVGGLAKGWLKSTINNYYAFSIEKEESQETPIGFFEAYEDYINKSEVSPNRKRHYWVVYRALKRYEEYKHLTLTFDNITGETLKDFERYLRDEHELYTSGELDRVFKKFPESREIEQRGSNHVKDMMGKLRAFCMYASGRSKDMPIDRLLFQRNPFDTYSIGKPDDLGTPYFLTSEERNTLYEATMPTERLARQRDIFVFQCLIGCRVGDLMRLTWDNVIGNKLQYIPAKTCKNNPKTLFVPMHPIAIEILNRYKEDGKKRLLPFVCQQQYNEDIKAMLTEAGITRIVVVRDSKTGKETAKPINEIASSHMARRTFVGNLYNQVQDPNLIGKLSGHVEGSKSFSRYKADNDKMLENLISMLG